MNATAVPTPLRFPAPRDAAGLELSTTPFAAAAYRDGLERLLALADGADAPFRVAIRADAGFALPYAALALLGATGATAVDVDACLFAAVVAVSRRGTERERSFVGALNAHLTRPLIRRRALLAHVRAYPRDRLALAVAHGRYGAPERLSA